MEVSQKNRLLIAAALAIATGCHTPEWGSAYRRALSFEDPLRSAQEWSRVHAHDLASQRRVEEFVEGASESSDDYSALVETGFWTLPCQPVEVDILAQEEAEARLLWSQASTPESAVILAVFLYHLARMQLVNDVKYGGVPVPGAYIGFPNVNPTKDPPLFEKRLLEVIDLSASGMDSPIPWVAAHACFLHVNAWIDFCAAQYSVTDTIDHKCSQRTLRQYVKRIAALSLVPAEYMRALEFKVNEHDLGGSYSMENAYESSKTTHIYIDLTKEQGERWFGKKKAPQDRRLRDKPDVNTASPHIDYIYQSMHWNNLASQIR